MPCFKVGMWWMGESERRREANFRENSGPQKTDIKVCHHPTTRDGGGVNMCTSSMRTTRILFRIQNQGRDSFPSPISGLGNDMHTPILFCCMLSRVGRDENNVFGEKVNLPLLYLAVNNLARDESIHPSSAFFFFSHPFHLMMILRHAFVTLLCFSSILI